MWRSRRRFREYSPSQHGVIAGIFAVSLWLVVAAERDIQHRPADQMRGSKLLWRLACLNALGSASYFLWGRRRTVNAPHV